jgi:hypothetical protein
LVLFWIEFRFFGNLKQRSHLERRSTGSVSTIYCLNCLPTRFLWSSNTIYTSLGMTRYLIFYPRVWNPKSKESHFKAISSSILATTICAKGFLFWPKDLLPGFINKKNHWRKYMVSRVRYSSSQFSVWVDVLVFKQKRM